MYTPYKLRLGNTVVPVTSVPMKLPSIMLSPFVSIRIALPEPKRLITNPRTVLFPPVILRPFPLASLPSSSIINTALRPSPVEFVLGLAPA